MSTVVDILGYSPAMETRLTFSEWLVDRYSAAGMTQLEFAERVDAGQSTVSGWVNAGKRPRRRMIPIIANVLGVSVDEVLERSGYIQPRPAPVSITADDGSTVEIDLSDPLISFAAMNQHLLTDAQKRAMVAFIRQFISEEDDRDS